MYTGLGPRERQTEGETDIPGTDRQTAGLLLMLVVFGAPPRPSIRPVELYLPRVRPVSLRHGVAWDASQTVQIYVCISLGVVVRWCKPGFGGILLPLMPCCIE